MSNIYKGFLRHEGLRKIFAGVLSCVLLIPALAFSWGEEGHETVALIAQSRLSQQSLQKIKEIKNGKFDINDVLTGEKPPFDFIDRNLRAFIQDGGIDLANIALWPDGFKFKPGMEASKEWHFIDLPIYKDITEKDFPDYCKDRGCVVDQINDQMKVLKDDSADPLKRFEALCYVVHFCGDITQPLHCADDHDRGGNAKKVYFMRLKNPVNLHSVWDAKIIQTYMKENREKSVKDFAQDIIQHDIPKDTTDWTNSEPKDWALESYDIAKNRIYPAYYESGDKTPKLGQDYVDEMSPIVKDQLAKGGVRLAALLNDAFGGTTPKTAPAEDNLPTESTTDPGDLDESPAGQVPDLGENGKWGIPSDENLIDKGTYVISYNDDYKIPNWVCYHLSSNDLANTLSRSGQWKEETAVDEQYRATTADYRNSGYDKGHLCPSADMARSKQTMQGTFVYSNCAPQVGAGFNRTIWMHLETQVRTWTKEKGDTWIYTGVFFDKDKEPKTIGNHVGVPPHWYKIVFSPPDSLIAFQFDNIAYKGNDYMAHEVPVDQIQDETGLHFLDKLDPKIREKIEAEKVSGDWN